MNYALVVVIVVVCSVLGAVGQVFFKLGSAKISGLNFSSLVVNVPLLLGLAFYGVATVVYVLMLRQGNLSSLYALIALSYVWVAVGSRFFLKEPVSTLNFFGFAVIVAGVFLAQVK